MGVSDCDQRGLYLSNVIELSTIKVKRKAEQPKRLDPQHQFVMNVAEYCMNVHPEIDIHDKAELLTILARLMRTTQDSSEVLP